MQFLASHQAGRVLSAGADLASAQDLHRAYRPADTDAFTATAKVVELNVFKKTAPVFDKKLASLPLDRLLLSPDLAASLLEELRQARFREARRLKHTEMLEREMKAARAQNDALRAALELARADADETPTAPAETDAGATNAEPDPVPTDRAIVVVRQFQPSRSFLRLFRARRRHGPGAPA